MKNTIIILFSALVIIVLFFQALKFIQPSNEVEETQNARVKDLTIVEQGYGVNVIAEIENLNSKEIKFCEVTFTWHDSQGKLINSQGGVGKNIKPNSTGIADSYFTGIPKGQGATCKATIGEILF